MSVRREQDTGGGVRRLVAVLSAGATGGGDDERKRQRASLFEYETEYEGTVRAETVMFRAHASLSGAAEERTHYYVQMDDVDDKFYFYNVREHNGLQASMSHTLKANFNGTTYRFIDGMVTSSSLPALDPVFPLGTRVLFKPIAASEFKAAGEWSDEVQPTWRVRGGKAATMIKRIDEASSSSSSHAMVRAEGSGGRSRLREVEEGLEAISRFYDKGWITREDFEAKKQELLSRV